MAFDFPASPSIDQDFIAGTVTYTYNGTGWVLKGTSTSQFVSKSGDTMTGDLTLTKSNPSLILNKPDGSTGNNVHGKVNGTNRWAMVLGDSTVAETGSNSGSDFRLYNFGDAGGFLSTALLVTRATGAMNVGSTAASTSPTTGALTVAGGVGVNGALYVAGDTVLRNTYLTGLGVDGTRTAAVISNISNISANTKVGVDYWVDASVLARWVVGRDGIGTTGQISLQTARGAPGTTVDAITINGGNVVVPATTASTSPTTGALTVAGGVGISGTLYGSHIFLNRKHSGSFRRLVWCCALFQWYSTNIVERYADTLQFSKYGSIAALRLNLTTSQVSVPATTASTSPTTGALVVAGGVGISGVLHTGGIGIGAAYGSLPGFGNSNVGAEIQSAGILAVSRAAAGVAFFGQNADGAIVSFARNGTGVGSISVTTTATAYNTSSDIRGKPNREPLSPNTARNIIDALEVYDFDKDGNAIRGIGLVAQQAHSVHKSFATPGTKDEDWWMAEKAAPVPFMIANIQLLNKEIAELKRQLKKETK